MSRRLAIVLFGLAVSAINLTGCASSGMGMGRSLAFAKNDQWEPEVEEAETSSKDWKKTAASYRKGTGFQDPIDKYIMSDTAREIEQNVGGRF